MPNKYAEKKGWKLPKQKYKVVNWSEYNKALRQCGSIDVWLSDEIVNFWYEEDRVNNGTGSPQVRCRSEIDVALAIMILSVSSINDGGIDPLVSAFRCRYQTTSSGCC